VNRAALAVAFIVLAGCASQKPAPVVDRKQAQPRAKAPAPAAARAAPVTEGTYVVKKGDTLYSIALENGADYREVAQWNRLDDPTKIQVGQVLRVTPPEDRSVQVGRAKMPERGEARPLDLPPPQGTQGRKPAGAAEKATPSPQETPAATAAEFIWPARGKVIAGFAEPRRKGIDIDGKLGDPVIAAAAGRVTYTGTGIPGLGKLVVIKHDNGFITVYAHNRDILVKEQQAVKRGQKIAEVGNTDADRPKLHFQIRKGSAAVDPMRYLPSL
jgi:lipoprotein NlpD